MCEQGWVLFPWQGNIEAHKQCWKHKKAQMISWRQCSCRIRRGQLAVNLVVSLDLE